MRLEGASIASNLGVSAATPRFIGLISIAIISLASLGISIRSRCRASGIGLRPLPSVTSRSLCPWSRLPFSSGPIILRPRLSLQNRTSLIKVSTAWSHSLSSVSIRIFSSWLAVTRGWTTPITLIPLKDFGNCLSPLTNNGCPVTRVTSVILSRTPVAWN